MGYKNDAVIMLLLFLNCLGKSDVLCLGGMMWKKAAVKISATLIHITAPVRSSAAENSGNMLGMVFKRER